MGEAFDRLYARVELMSDRVRYRWWLWWDRMVNVQE
jgi:hypothetical protein